MRAPLILYVTNLTPYFFSHRIGVAREAMRRGMRVALAGPDVDDHREALAREGIEPVPISGGTRGVDPLGDLVGARNLARWIAREKPDAVHATALKTIFLCALANRFTPMPRTVCIITGLGATYINEDAKSRLIRSGVELVLRSFLRRASTITVFQNGDDLAFFTERRLIRPGSGVLIKGSGVDTQEFAVTGEPPADPAVVVFPARLLATKGLREFVAAAEILRARGVAAKYALVGGVDLENPDGIPQAEIDRMTASGVVENWGFRTDMPRVLASSHVVCLPSYREGLPKSLIEAAAMGKPIVTADTPGCREIVRHEVNGYLVPARTVEPLADALQKLIEDADLRRKFGSAGRAMVEAEFSLDSVARQTVDLYLSAAR